MFQDSVRGPLLAVPAVATLYNVMRTVAFGREAVLFGVPSKSRFIGSGRRVGGLYLGFFRDAEHMRTFALSADLLDGHMTDAQMAAVWAHVPHPNV